MAGIVIGFVLLTGIFFILERISPGIKGQRILRRGFWTDLIYWFFTPLVSKTLASFVVLAPAFVLIAAGIVSAEQLKNHAYFGFGPVSRQPVWLQALEMFVVGDFIGYWMHRLFHTGRWWKFHAVHHSSQEVDWLSSVRLHPVNDLATRFVQVFPPLFLGFNPTVLVAYTPVLAFYSILLHANVNWSYGPLRAVIASPVFHRWHHTNEEAGLDKNFAGFFPFWDLLFGTYYMPKGQLPTQFGIPDKMPEHIVGQLLFPFRGEGRDANNDGHRVE